MTGIFFKCILHSTYRRLIGRLLNTFPQRPGTITHQVCDLQAFTQVQERCIFVSVSATVRRKQDVKFSLDVNTDFFLCFIFEPEVS